jgi:hypothetical protein
MILCKPAVSAAEAAEAAPAPAAGTSMAVMLDTSAEMMLSEVEGSRQW